MTGRIAAALVSFSILAGTAPALGAGGLTLALADPAWTGGEIPDGQQCTKFGGSSPMTPALKVGALPAGTVEVVVEFNDAGYQPLSYDGGHGVLAFAVKAPGEAVLPAVAGETADMPAGVRLVSKNRARGSFGRPGYLPPCSGGEGHRYFAVVKAVDAGGAVLAEGEITIGSY